jgi:arylsulfatase A-like enzyme
MNRRNFLKATVSLAASGALSQSALPAAPGATGDRPNIVWIVVEDMSCHFGYQGQALVHTPHIDRLAEEGAVFTNAYVTAPVCSASRSALITGM